MNFLSSFTAVFYNIYYSQNIHHYILGKKKKKSKNHPYINNSIEKWETVSSS